MGFSKVIALGNAGSLTITEAGGIASVKVSVSESVGGGSVSGVAKAQLSAEVDVSAAMLIDAGLKLAAEKFPSAAIIIASVQAMVDAELAKI